MIDKFGIPEPQSDGGALNLAAEMLSTVVKGMLLVAFIDGRPHWNAREVLIESVWMALQHANSDSDPENVLKFLDESAELLEGFPESAWSGFFESAQQLPGGMKRIILGMCMKLAFADGHLTPNESRLIHQIADWIDIDRQNRELWKADVRTALNDGMARGLRFTGTENLDRETGSLK